MLSLKGGLSFLQEFAGRLMIHDAQILAGAGTDFRFGTGGGNGLFVEGGRFGRILVAGLSLETFIVEDDGRDFLCFFRVRLIFLNRGRRREGRSGLGLILGGKGGSGEHGGDQEKVFCRGNLSETFFRESEPETEKDERGEEGENGAFDGTRLFATVEFLDVELADARLDLGESGAGGGGTYINSAGFAGEERELFFIERGVDNVAAVVLEGLDAAVFGGDLNDAGL